MPCRCLHTYHISYQYLRLPTQLCSSNGFSSIFYTKSRRGAVLVLYLSCLCNVVGQFYSIRNLVSTRMSDLVRVCISFSESFLDYTLPFPSTLFLKVWWLTFNPLHYLNFGRIRSDITHLTFKLSPSPSDFEPAASPRSVFTWRYGVDVARLPLSDNPLTSRTWM